MMTDKELAKFLGITGTKECAKILATFTPGERASFETMKQVDDQLRLYVAGKGPKPAGVIICRERKRR